MKRSRRKLKIEDVIAILMASVLVLLFICRVKGWI